MKRMAISHRRDFFKMGKYRDQPPYRSFWDGKHMAISHHTEVVWMGRCCLRLRFLDVETNPGPRRPVPAVCRIFCSNVRGLAGNLSDLTVASYQYAILFAQRLWSQILVTCRSCSFPVSVALSCCAGARYLGPVGWLHTYEMVAEHVAKTNLSAGVAKCNFLGFVV